jgi:flagellar protein FlaF
MSVTTKHKAYAANQRNDETVRETEALALLNCANRLEAACKPDCSDDDFVAHVKHNQELWTIFQSCLCDKSNELPADLKTILLNLSIFVDKTSVSAIMDRNVESLKSLIDINRNLAAGIRVKAKATSSGDGMPPSPAASGPISATA